MYKDNKGSRIAALLLSGNTNSFGRFYSDQEVAKKCGSGIEYVRKIRRKLGIKAYKYRISDYYKLVLRQHTNVDAASILGINEKSVARKRKLAGILPVTRVYGEMIATPPDDCRWIVIGEPFKNQKGRWQVQVKCGICSDVYIVATYSINQGRSKNCRKCAIILRKKNKI